MLDREAVTAVDALQDRLQDRLVEIVDPLAPDAHEMVVMLGLAGDIARDVSRPLEAPRHTAFHLGLERAVDGGEPQTRVLSPQPVVQLLR